MKNNMKEYKYAVGINIKYSDHNKSPCIKKVSILCSISIHYKSICRLIH